MKIGFIGQGYVGKNCANDFERRGHSTVRYALEAPYNLNKEKVSACDIVFIAVPTPTTPKGFDDSIVREALRIVKKGAIAVIKSTMPPGHTAAFQKQFPNLTILFSPEFLSEVTAAHDAAHPFANIVGLGKDTPKHRAAAKKIHRILPPAPHASTCNSIEAECIKFAHNGSGYVQIVFFNLLYDLATSYGATWNNIEEIVRQDPYISNRYSKPIHKSGRGAGGHCFIKDFATLRMVYEKKRKTDVQGIRLLKDFEAKNNQLLKDSGKDLDLLAGVYGNQRSKKKR